MLYENSMTDYSDKNLYLLEIHAKNMEIKFKMFSAEQYFFK